MMTTSLTPRSRSRLSLAMGAALCAGLLAVPVAATAGPPDHAGGPGKGQNASSQRGSLPPGLAKKDTLRDAAPSSVRIGTAVAGGGHHEAEDYPEPFPNDQEYRAFVAANFSSITPENQMKWEYLRPSQDEFNFTASDDIVSFAAQHGQHVRGHALLWHSQNPEWLLQGDFTDDELREILRDHIHTVVGRYAGQIQHWEVTNEIFTDGPNPQLRSENIFLDRLGPEIIADAFRWAHEADPRAVLYMNDYNVDGINPKSNAYYALIQELLADGVPIHGFGSQHHLGLQYGFSADSMAANFARFGALGLETAVTEIDVRGYVDDADVLDHTHPQMRGRDRQTQADWYSDALAVCLGESSCTSFTVWGVLDEHSWVPNTFAGQGDALLLEGDYDRKPAFCAIQQTLVEANPGGSARWVNHPAYQACRDLQAG
ncbi:endo-1,4-beta-xylanase [Ornithinimicrobium sp. Y1847]|uniref:endo-1,4-beta-xylanase n=1 Tax=Ornithinimicrobium sp. Y1847 TaxID=3405419 RepID=UPI003B678019